MAIELFVCYCLGLYISRKEINVYGHLRCGYGVEFSGKAGHRERLTSG